MQIKSSAMRFDLIPLKMAMIKKATNKKSRTGCGEKGTLLYSWWECKLMQPLRKTVWKFLKKLKIELPYDLPIPFLGMSEWVSEVAQLCLTLWDPMDCSLPGSSVHEIFQARVLKCGAISFSGDLPDPGIEPRSQIEPGSPILQVNALPSKPPGKPQGIYLEKTNLKIYMHLNVDSSTIYNNQDMEAT